MLRPVSRAEINFQLDNEIGMQGKNSFVYRARDLQLNASLAIKKIPKEKFSNIEEFFNEASLLHLSNHGNVVPIHYACQDDDHVYLAMPFFERGSLKTEMALRRLTVREIITYSTQFLSGLHNIHSKRLIHFDIKPDNILLSSRGEALLSDFGLAKQTSIGGTVGQDRIYGKIIPPEAFQQAEFCNRFDIYQSGLTIYRMCVGDDSFNEQYQQFHMNGELDRHRYRHAVVNGQFPARDEYPEHIPQPLISTIRRCLEVNPQNRFRSASEVVNSFADVEGSLLDWQFENHDDYRQWTKFIQDRQIVLRVNNNGSSVAKKISHSGDERRIREYCSPNLSRAEIKRFLREH